MSIPSATEFVERLRPAGGRRSGKRDFIVTVFLRQEGHISADELVDLIRQEDARISRATIYRTLEWMVEAGIARRVDFGEGRFRFEHSYRHPRHFHLICKTCNQALEFLSSDIEALIEEVASARRFEPGQSVLQIYGTCESCQTGNPVAAPTASTEAVFARDALRIAIATERSGLEFYTRASRLTRDARGRRLTVIKLPMPGPLRYRPEEVLGVQARDGVRGRIAGMRLAASYVNFYIANGGVVMPLLDPRTDKAAAAKLKRAFPGRKVVGVPAREILLGGGNIHCITQQVPR